MESHQIVRCNHTEEEGFPIKSSRFFTNWERVRIPRPPSRSSNSSRILVSGVCGHTVRTNFSSNRFVDLKNGLALCLGPSVEIAMVTTNIP